MDYSNLGLDANLQPVNSPITNNGQGDMNSMNYDSTLDRSSVTNALLRDNQVTTVKIANLAVTNAKIVNLDANKINAGTVIVGVNLPAANILSGTLSTALNVGTAASGYVLIDGPNNRIIVNDGTTNRIVIGNI